MEDCSVEQLMNEIGQNAKNASRELASVSPETKTKALLSAAQKIWEMRGEILEANKLDIVYGKEKGLSDAMIDRLFLDEDRISAIKTSLEEVADLEDPIGKSIASWERPTGLTIDRVRTPLGVIGVIYESRPNVTADAGALCLKAGNAVILRGGSESFHSSSAIHEALVQGLRSEGLPETSIQLIPTRDRAAVSEMLKATQFIDVIVPRGGKGLVGLVQSEARVPVFAHLDGVCHIYVDRSADMEKARKIILNAKTRRTGICGAAECILIDKAFYSDQGAPFIQDLLDAGVEVYGDETLQTIKGVSKASEEDWGKEYLDMKIAAKIVDGVGGAIDHLNQYSSNHTDCIISEDENSVQRFFENVDSAILMHNASTQFADGGEFGMGAEIGIATGKMHARGPVGVEQLTSFKYLVRGNGTIRA